LSAAISLGFGTFAAYVYLRALEGPIVAALIVSVAYGLLAIAIWAMVAVRRRGGRLRRAAAAPAPASRGNVASPTRYLLESDATQDQQSAIAAMRLVRDLSATQLLALALVGGFIAGRRIGNSGFAPSRRSGGLS
jgi:hypothetical protein